MEVLRDLLKRDISLSVGAHAVAGDYLKAAYLAELMDQGFG